MGTRNLLPFELRMRVWIVKWWKKSTEKALWIWVEEELGEEISGIHVGCWIGVCFEDVKQADGLNLKE